jgi:tetratricopeptide (TPR) repeat protein
VAAERVHRETLELRSRVLGATHPYTQDSCNELAFAILKQGRFGEALDIAKETLATCRATLRETHETTLMALYLTGLCHASEGRLSTAEPLLRQAVAGARSGDSVEPVVEALFEAHLGLVLGQLGRHGEATEALDHSLPALPIWEDETSSVLRSAILLYDGWSATDPDGEDGKRAAEARRLLNAERPLPPN